MIFAGMLLSVAALVVLSRSTSSSPRPWPAVANCSPLRQLWVSVHSCQPGATTWHGRLLSSWWVSSPSDSCERARTLPTPGQEIDLRVNADLRALTQVWMGDRTMADACDAGTIEMLGPSALTRRFPIWLGSHPVLGGVTPAAP